MRNLSGFYLDNLKTRTIVHNREFTTKCIKEGSLTATGIRTCHGCHSPVTINNQMNRANKLVQSDFQQRQMNI